MSSTVVRVKRHLSEDPVNALLLSYKRRKTEEDAEDVPAQALLKFTATVKDNSIEDVKKVLKNANTKEDLEETFKRYVPDIKGKQRAASQTRSKENRFKILSCNRSTESTKEEESPPITIVDVGTCEEMPESQRAPSEYVYDLYSTDFMPEEADVNDGYFQSLVSVEPFSMVYRTSEDSEEIDPYEEDSNEESNWKNDYPDSDNSINEDDMRLAASLRGMGLDNGVDLSSDSDDERYLDADGSSPPRGFDAYKRKYLQEQKRNFIDVVEMESSSESDEDGEAADESYES